MALAHGAKQASINRLTVAGIGVSRRRREAVMTTNQGRTASRALAAGASMLLAGFAVFLGGRDSINRQKRLEMLG